MKGRFPAPTVDEHDIYPTCFEVGTWFASKLTDDDPPRKIPRTSGANPDHHDRYVGHNDPDVWMDFKTMREWTAKFPGFGLANRVPDVDAGEQRPVFSTSTMSATLRRRRATPKCGSSFRATTSCSLEEMKRFWQRVGIWPDEEPRHVYSPAIQQPDEPVWLDYGGDPIPGPRRSGAVACGGVRRSGRGGVRERDVQAVRGSSGRIG